VGSLIKTHDLSITKVLRVSRYHDPDSFTIVGQLCQPQKFYASAVTTIQTRLPSLSIFVNTQSFTSAVTTVERFWQEHKFYASPGKNNLK